ncbi:hypothetical protein [Nocardioides marmoribigeumensis]|uniref:Uncharacterized protein n=1 Tax=Nocardioides marmoribigeumensis TaxID=433649 RepID=A0ABU2BQU3_9ACTN|nr:hypothetical protein [Nocardioides marmoribigeumensis]MDR7360641.1 hypothetical protein [Nocardioides marmoribigeumensis]
MHYAPVLSDHLVNGNVRERDGASVRARRIYVAKRGAWRNWWSMSVVEQPRLRTPRARPVGARGRLPRL